jgi:hypothetical protein
MSCYGVYSSQHSARMAVWPCGNTRKMRENAVETGGRKRKFVTASRRICLVTTLLLTASINEPYYSITLVLHIHAGQITLGHVNRGIVWRVGPCHTCYTRYVCYIHCTPSRAWNSKHRNRVSQITLIGYTSLFCWSCSFSSWNSKQTCAARCYWLDMCNTDVTLAETVASIF